MTADECLDEAQLDELAAGRLSGAAAEALRCHLAGCRECRDRLNECRHNLDYYNDMADALRAQRAGPRDDPQGAGRPFPAARLAEPARLDLQEPARPPEAVPGYRIIRELHRGGQGVVYEAVQLSTRRTVALKMLLEGPGSSERARWRFEREVKLIAALRHPNIVVIHDSGICSGRHFFAMDYVRGQPLDTHVRLTAPPRRAVVHIFRLICDAVAHAHRRGVIHRDLKPSNVLLNESGTPFVLDFGLAKGTGDEIKESQDLNISVAGHLMGTIRYMSPEQTRGVPEAVDTRTDVYSLGVMLYEALCGSPPYQTSADLATTFRNIREVNPPRPSRLHRDVDADLDTIVLKAMSKEPERRYQSAGELADDLGAWLDGRPIAAKSASSFYVIRKLAVRHSFESLAVLSIIAAIIGFAAVSFSQYRKAQRDADALRDVRGQLLMTNQSLAAERDEIRATLRTQVFGWFLVEWEAGRTARAAELLGEVPAAAPEHAAMRFLLDDSRSPDDLRRRLGVEQSGLAAFAVGISAWREGRLDDARASFEDCCTAPGGAWIRAAAQARLDALVGQAGGPSKGRRHD